MWYLIFLNLYQCYSHNNIAVFQNILETLTESEGELTCLQQTTICISFPSFSLGEIRIIENILVLTSNLLSRLAFLKAEVTELASFSAIHALKSFTAKEAAIPVREKHKICFSNFQHELELTRRSTRLQKSYKTMEWKYIYDNRNKHVELKHLFFFL